MRILRSRWFLGGALAVVLAGGWLAYEYFEVHKLWVDDEVDEAAPRFASGATSPPTTVATSPTTEMVRPTRTVGAGPTTTLAGPPTTTVPPATTAPSAAPAVRTIASGDFRDRSHPTRGRALVLTDGSPQRFLRFEDFATDNGPDLNVYLSSAAPDAPAAELDDDIVDLGDLKGNVGSQNYAIPAGVDLARYRTVVIWCVRFSVAFGTAGLA